MRAAILAATALMLTIGTSGCITDIFVDTTVTTREFACVALSERHMETLILDVRVDETLDASPIDAVGHLRNVLAGLGHRSPESIEVRVAAIASIPAAWDEAAWDAELDGHRVREGLRAVTFTIYWVHDLPDAVTGAVLMPGVMALDQAGLEAKAAATGRSLDPVARAALLHHAGHALGGVNQGIPMQENHEGAAGHSAAIDSVMHRSWHVATDPTWAHNATYDGYSEAMRADWAAAVDDDLVCP